jgi:hypothetical protein
MRHENRGFMADLIAFRYPDETTAGAAVGEARRLVTARPTETSITPWRRQIPLEGGSRAYL